MATSTGYYSYYNDYGIGSGFHTFEQDKPDRAGVQREMNIDRSRGLFNPVGVTGSVQPFSTPTQADTHTLFTDSTSDELGTIFGNKLESITNAGEIPMTDTRALYILQGIADNSPAVGRVARISMEAADDNLDPAVRIALERDFGLQTSSLFDETGQRPQTYTSAIQASIKNYEREANLFLTPEEIKERESGVAGVEGVAGVDTVEPVADATVDSTVEPVADEWEIPKQGELIAPPTGDYDNRFYIRKLYDKLFGSATPATAVTPEKPVTPAELGGDTHRNVSAIAPTTHRGFTPENITVDSELAEPIERSKPGGEGKQGGEGRRAEPPDRLQQGIQYMRFEKGSKDYKKVLQDLRSMRSFMINRLPDATTPEETARLKMNKKIIERAIRDLKVGGEIDKETLKLIRAERPSSFAEFLRKLRRYDIPV